MVWSQVYDPLGNPLLSTLMAALPIVVLLGSLAFFHVKAHWAAILGLLVALAVAVFAFGMPPGIAGRTAVLGALFGLLPIGWIVLNVIFMYNLTNETGLFDVLQKSITGITDDRRLQLLLVAFCFGAFFEGAAGFGTPVAVTAAILMGLGFTPLSAAGLSLIANTAPVAFGALGTPIVVLSAVTGLDLQALSAMVGRQLPFFSLLVPFWLIWAFVGFRRMLEIWPAILVAGVAFAIPQFLVSNFHGPWLVDVDRVDVLDGGARAVPAGMAAETDLGQREPRRRDGVARGGRGKRGTAWLHASPGRQRVDAVAHPERAGVHLGTAAGQGRAQCALGAQVPDRRPPQHGRADAAGRRKADARGGGLHAELAVGDRYRHPHRGDRFGSRHGHSACRR